MSTKPPSRRHLNQLINVCCGAHDLICPCDEPTKHIILHLFSNEEPYFVTKEQKDNIIKCLITDDAAGTGTHTPAGDDAIGDGDLEKLFAEDAFEEEDTKG